MVQMNLVAIQPRSFKPRTTNSRHKLGYSPNLLLEGIELERINQIWVGDITYIPIPNAFAYLAVLMDLYSRKISSGALELDRTEPLVIAALYQAIRKRQPAIGLIHHTDRGGQYAGKKHRKILDRAKMSQSMSLAGDCYDNAFMESCFGTIKTELEMTEYENYAAALKELTQYVAYYNLERKHSALGDLTPHQFENLNQHPN